MQRGLGIIAARADALSRFTGAYARLARLPPPSRKPLDFGALMRRVVTIETRLPVALAGGPELTITADGDQLEQLLINVLRNAVDAALETGGGVAAGWSTGDGALELWIDDEGPACRTPATCSCRSSPPRQAARGSGSSSAGRSPKATAGRSTSRPAPPAPAPAPRCDCRFREFRPYIRTRDGHQ